MIKLNKPLLLASSSEARKMLLKRLQIPFESVSPDIDESPLAGESAAELALRLAKQKAQAVARQADNHYIVSSDQVAICDGKLLSKPMNETKAMEQLKLQSAKTTTFYTSLCLLDSHDQSYQLDVKSYSVTFRPLLDREIRHYIAVDQPFHCAGGFKSESFGISLFEKMAGDDPNTLVGLPLILLTQFLRNVSDKEA